MVSEESAGEIRWKGISFNSCKLSKTCFSIFSNKSRWLWRFNSIRDNFFWRKNCELILHFYEKSVAFSDEEVLIRTFIYIHTYGALKNGKCALLVVRYTEAFESLKSVVKFISWRFFFHRKKVGRTNVWKTRDGVNLMRGGATDSLNGEIAEGFSTENFFMFFQNVEVIPKWEKERRKKKKKSELWILWILFYIFFFSWSCRMQWITSFARVRTDKLWAAMEAL